MCFFLGLHVPGWVSQAGSGLAWGWLYLPAVLLFAILVYSQILRRQVEARTRDLARLKDFEGLLAEISNGFINVEPRALDQVIERALERLGRFMDVERANLYQMTSDGQKIICTHEWQADEVTPINSQIRELSLADLPWLRQRYAEGLPTAVTSMKDIPAAAGKERSLFESLDTASLLCVPVKVNGRVRGHAGFAMVREQRVWQPEHVARLRTVGEILSCALDRRRTEMDRRLSEEKFTKAFQTSPDTIVLSRLSDGQILEVNDGFTTMMGYARDEALGKTSVEVGLWLKPSEREKIAEQLAVKGAVTNLDVAFRHKAGHAVDVLFSASVLTIASEACVLGVGHDITERKCWESELRRLNTELEARVAERTADLRERIEEVESLNTRLAVANSELEAFTASVSHDLRAPARNVQGFTEILAEELGVNSPPEVARLLGVIQTEAKRMGELIDALLQLSRLGRVDIRKVPLHLEKLVREVIKEFEPQTQGRQVEWQIGPLPTVLADPVLLRQVWTNLLGNALKYSRGREPAIIEVSQVESNNPAEWIFRVKDNGAGFNPRYADKLFVPFQRLHSAKEFEGTGIGLANARRIIDRHGGRMWAESEPGQGATFFFSLPKTEVAVATKET